MKEKKIGGIDSMINLLKTGTYTEEELLNKTGLSKVTISLQLKYKLPKKGVKIVKSNKEGVVAYTIAND